MKKTSDVKSQVVAAITACESKRAADIAVLQLSKNAGGFTDYFLICSGSNPRQIQAISDEVEERLSAVAGLRPAHVEGYRQAEWVLLDYVDFVVHIFSEKARKYYELERLWKSAKQLDPKALRRKPAHPTPPRKRAARPATQRKRRPARARKK